MYTRRIYNLRTYNEREQGLRFGLVCYVRVFHSDVFKVNLVRTYVRSNLYENNTDHARNKIDLI